MHTHLDAAERRLLIQEFQETRPRRDDSPPLRVLVGTTNLMGQGYTLHKASRLVLMEPNPHAAVEAQIADRVHRLGSRTDRSWFYRLIAPESALEKGIVEDHELQVEESHMAEYHQNPNEDAGQIRGNGNYDGQNTDEGEDSDGDEESIPDTGPD